jgi:hypothetical protein
LQLGLRHAQRVVLHLQFNLMDLQFMQQHPGILHLCIRWPGLDTLFRLPAQCRMGLFRRAIALINHGVGFFLFGLSGFWMR